EPAAAWAALAVWLEEKEEVPSKDATVERPTRRGDRSAVTGGEHCLGRERCPGGEHWPGGDAVSGGEHWPGWAPSDNEAREAALCADTAGVTGLHRDPQG